MIFLVKLCNLCNFVNFHITEKFCEKIEILHQILLVSPKMLIVMCGFYLYKLDPIGEERTAKKRNVFYFSLRENSSFVILNSSINVFFQGLVCRIYLM